VSKYVRDVTAIFEVWGKLVVPDDYEKSDYHVEVPLEVEAEYGRRDPSLGYTGRWFINSVRTGRKLKFMGKGYEAGIELPGELIA
jgi:hypothetical protein